MDAHFSLSDGGSAHIGCSMFSSSVLRMHAEITGENGKISVFNPFSPQYGHRVKVTTSLGSRKERFSRKATYDYQLEAFAAAVEDGAADPHDGGRRDPYDGAHRLHLRRRRSPPPSTHPSALMPLSADESPPWPTPRSTPPPVARPRVRVERIRSQTVRPRDALPETTADDTDFGMGVRVVVDGAVGFAASVDVRPEEAANLVHQARQMAALTNQAGGGRVELAPEPRTARSDWSSASRSTRPRCRWPTRRACWPSGAPASVATMPSRTPRPRCCRCRSTPSWPT